ncbi:MAG: aspartyl/glutamyl-tRNA amidotransferase subunit C [Candidatus Komeilibacteria bacterium]
MAEHITWEEAQHLADLARLHVTKEEVKQLQLETVLDYVDRIQALDTTGVKPFSDSRDFSRPARIDEPEVFPPASELLPGKTTESGLLAVKQIFDHEA